MIQQKFKKESMLSRSRLFLRRRPIASFAVPTASFSSFSWSRGGIEASTTPPSAWYTDPQFLSKVERKHTFQNWLQICSVHDVKNDGEFFAATVNNQPIVIVNSQGTFKAFYNVCRHHAAQICDNGPGKIGPQGRFTCPYHGWQYNADGRLVKAIQMKGCKDFSPKNFGLHPVQLDRMGPWLYINFNKASSGTILGDHPDLQQMHDMLSATGYEDLVPIQRRSYTIKCNWKVFVDNYLDGGYHVPVAHPGLTSSLDMSGYTRKEYPNFYLQSCGAKKDCDAGNGNSSGYSGRSEARVSGEALYIFQYPNIMINRYGKWLDTNIVWPVNEKECVVDFVWSVDKSLLGADQAKGVEESIKQSDQVQQEDVWLCERVQAGLQSDGYDVGRYAPTIEGMCTVRFFYHFLCIGFSGGEYMFHEKLYKDYEASELFEK